jgi:hypothetical protein
MKVLTVLLLLISTTCFAQDSVYVLCAEHSEQLKEEDYPTCMRINSTFIELVGNKGYYHFNNDMLEFDSITTKDTVLLYSKELNIELTKSRNALIDVGGNIFIKIF